MKVQVVTTSLLGNVSLIKWGEVVTNATKHSFSYASDQCTRNFALESGKHSLSQ